MTFTNIMHCYNTGNINGGTSSGIVGNASSSKIEYCNNKGNINCPGYYSAGIVALATNSTVSRCSNEGSVYTGYSYSAGIACSGDSNTVISECYNKGEISGKGSVGGITEFYINTKNCYNTGTLVSSGGASSGVAGISGQFSKIENCYNIGNLDTNVNYKGSIATTYAGIPILKYAFGLEGTHPYLYGRVSKETLEDGTIKNTILTEGQLKGLEKIENSNNILYYLNYGEDENGNSIDTGIWKLDTSNINNGYPILTWQIQ